MGVIVVHGGLEFALIGPSTLHGGKYEENRALSVHVSECIVSEDIVALFDRVAKLTDGVSRVFYTGAHRDQPECNRLLIEFDEKAVTTKTLARGKKSVRIQSYEDMRSVATTFVRLFDQELLAFSSEVGADSSFVCRKSCCVDIGAKIAYEQAMAARGA